MTPTALTIHGSTATIQHRNTTDSLQLNMIAKYSYPRASTAFVWNPNSGISTLRRLKRPSLVAPSNSFYLIAFSQCICFGSARDIRKSLQSINVFNCVERIIVLEVDRPSYSNACPI